MKLWVNCFLAAATAAALAAYAAMETFPPCATWCAGISAGAASLLFLEAAILRRIRRLRGEVQSWTQVAPPRITCPAGRRDEIDSLSAALSSTFSDLSAQFERTQSWGKQVSDSSEARLLALEEALQKSEANSVQKTRFLASMSHELRTPIGAILGYAEILEEDRGSPDERKQAILSIRRNGEHLLDLVNDILDLSKIEAGKLEIELMELTLEKVLKDVLSVMSARAQAKGLRLEEIYLNPVPARIVSDATRIRQVIINLVGNAVKFTERGLVTLAVSHEALEDGESRLSFRVQDTGIGIAPEKLDQLFKPFQQVHSGTNHKYGGTGLGLAISKEIARLLGGDITVRSDVGLGSLFTFSIRCKLVEGTPLLRRPSSAVLEDTKRLRGRPGGDSGKVLTGRILVVDDSADNRKLFRYHLEAAGMKVELAENGKEGVAKGASEPFDVILMDIQMPELDGFGALKELRARGVQTPIVALTAHAMRGDRENCLNAGFTDYLSKPVSRAALLGKVGELMAGPDPEAVSRSAESEDPELDEIVAAYRESLAARALLLDQSGKERDIEALRLQVHMLKGTLGSMGFDALSAVATKAYDALQGSDLDEALKHTSELAEACRQESTRTAPVVLR